MKAKETYKGFYFVIADLDPIVGESKYYKNCGKNLTRSQKFKKDPKTYPFFSDFNASLSQIIDHNVLVVNISISSAVKISFLGENRINIDEHIESVNND